MNDSIQSCCSLWWIFPVMMIFCFFMMRRRRGAMICGFGPRRADDKTDHASDSAFGILDRRYASGEIDLEEYEEKKRKLSGSADSRHT